MTIRPSDVRDLTTLAGFLAKGLHKIAYASARRFPYGLWTCADGRQILFDRSYAPLWQRLPDDEVASADPYEWVAHIVRQEHFFSDLPEWHRQYLGMKRLRAVLVEWRFIRRNKDERGAQWREYKKRRASDAR
jgi:hypothetical protein